MDWRKDWEAFITAKEAELRELDAWISEKMPKVQHGQKTYDVISSDPLLMGLVPQRLLIRQELAQARKYITRKEAV